jgi:hypothetical protein
VASLRGSRDELREKARQAVETDAKSESPVKNPNESPV